MTDEQFELLTERLDFLSEALNNTQGYLQYLATLKGYGRHEVDAPNANDDGQYWNRLVEAGGEDGLSSGTLRQEREQLELPNTLSDEEKAHIAALVLQKQSRARLQAQRKRGQRKGRRK